MDKKKPQGCWAKLDAWLAPIGSLNIILDLDICIISDIAQIVSKLPAAACDPKDTPEHPWLNGSVISWRSHLRTQRVYPLNIPYKEYPRGEQEYVQKSLGKFEPMAGVYSFKGHLTDATRRRLPRDTVIVYFHGRPTPATDTVQLYDWISRTWQGLERIERV